MKRPDVFCPPFSLCPMNSDYGGLATAQAIVFLNRAYRRN